MDTMTSLYETCRPYLPYIVAGGAVLVTAKVFLVIKRVGEGSGVGSIQAPPNTAIIYQMKRGPFVPALSPFPLKLETFCRMAKIPYLVDTSGRFSSRGKIPWMTYNGEIVEDSQFCIEYFKNKHGIDMNSHLSVEERAVSRFIQVLVDEHLYWTMAAYRWNYDENFAVLFKKHYGYSSVVLRMIRRHVKDMCYKQGIGRHTEEQVNAIMMEDLSSLSKFLGTKPFILGEQMCEADCSVFGQLVQIEWHAEVKVMENLLKDKFPNLHQYCHRIKEKLWPDWEECLKNE